jgi:hypothetical protein
VVVNLSARSRSGLVELIVPGEGELPGCQVLHVRPPEAVLASFPSASMAAGIVAELEYVNRFTAATIVDDATGSVLFETGRSASGRLVGSDHRAALEALMAGADDRPVTVRVRQVPGRKVLAHVEDVPGFGWAAWSAPSATPDLAPVVAGEGAGSLTNGLVTVDSASFRLVDGGDVGDTYNWCPPEGDQPVELPVVSAEVTETGPLRGRLRLVHAAPEGDLTVTHVVELRAGEHLVRVESTVENRRRDHRLRIHLPLPVPATASEAECAFAVVTRGLTAEGGPTELGLPTFPSRRFVRAGGLTAVHEGLNEYELVGIDPTVDGGAATELALTLVRCTGMLSQGPMATRPLPAGPFDRLEGPQLQTTLRLRWGFTPEPADAYALVDEAFLPLRATDGGAGLDVATRPGRGSALSVIGAEVSAVRRTPDGRVEVRVVNASGEPAVCELAGRRGWVVDLRGRPLAPWEERVALRPWEIATLVLSS